MAKKLLVADDSLTIQKVIKLALSHDGYEIQTVANGNDFIAQVSLFRPDVILIDLGLPGKSTFEAKKELNETDDLKNIPCVLMASAFEKVDEAKVGLLGFDGRLTKPFDPSHLREVLQKAISSRSPGMGSFDASSLPPPPRRTKEELPKFDPPPFDPMPESEPTSSISLNDPIWSGAMPEIPSEFAPPPQERLDSFSSLEPEPTLIRSHSSLIADDSDIKHLTESTVKMSGLDDLGGWNINDSSASSLAPLPSIFDSEKPEMTGTSSRMPPPPPLRSPASFQAPPVSSSTLDPLVPSRVEAALAEIPSSKDIEEMVEKQVQAQLEELLKKQVSQHLEKFIRNALPDVAERLVKQELRKLLEDLS